MIDNRIMHLLFATNEARFKCSRCGACCGFEVELSTNDIGRLSKVDPQLKKRLEQSSKHPPIIPQVWNSGKTRCVYLEDGGKKRCSVYYARPSICMFYPFFPILASEITSLGIKMPKNITSLNWTRNGSKIYVALDPLCPGLGHGSKVDWQNFREQFEHYFP